MSSIIAGSFEQADQAEAAVQALVAAGVARDQVCSFFVNPPGQHAKFAIGGDEDKSPGSTRAHIGAAEGAGVGAAVGIGVGLATAPFIGPASVAAGMAAGAFAGSLAGGVGTMGSGQNQNPSISDAVIERKGGMLVAAVASGAGAQASIVGALRQAGARDIEQAQGAWQAGRWSDFDPTLPPQLV